MPVHDRVIVLPRAPRNSFVGFSMGILLKSSRNVFIIVILSRNIDMGNLKIHLRDKFNSSDLGHNVEDRWAAPDIINKGCISGHC
jgi:hypothetical protein